MADDGITFDANYQIRILDADKFKATEALQGQAGEFVAKVTQFEGMVTRLLGTVDEQAAKLERQKLRAVGLRNRVTAEGEARRRLEVGQHAAVAGKRETLDRLTREHESLRKAISAQELEMSRLAGGR